MTALPPERTLTFFGPIRPPATTSLRTALCQMVNEGAKKVTILFASEGGSTEDGIALYAFLQSLELDITMHAIGWISSMAIPVFLAAPRRFASKHSGFFFHEYSWTHGQGGSVTQSTMTEQNLLLQSAMIWTQEVVNQTTKLTDSDFQRMKLFDILCSSAPPTQPDTG